MANIFILQTVNPSGCRCPAHYVLNSHFRCVRPGHSSSVYVDPTGCTCPANYQLNQHNRCKCISFRSCATGFYWDQGTCSCRPIIDMCPDCSDIPWFNYKEILTTAIDSQKNGFKPAVNWTKLSQVIILFHYWFVTIIIFTAEKCIIIVFNLMIWDTYTRSKIPKRTHPQPYNSMLHAESFSMFKGCSLLRKDSGACLHWGRG